MSLTKRELESVEESERDQQEWRDENSRFDDADIEMEPAQFLAALERAFSRMEKAQCRPTN